MDMLSLLGHIRSCVAFGIIVVHTSESSRNIRNKTFSVRLESYSHLIKSIKLKKRPFPCEIAPVMCVLKKGYVSS